MRALLHSATALACWLLIACGGGDIGAGLDAKAGCELRNEGCLCDPSIDDAVSCYDGPGSAVGVGVCEKGTRSCDPLTSMWGACDGQVLPNAETCDALDNDCDGDVEEGLDDCTGLVRYPGPCRLSGDTGIDGSIERVWIYMYDANNLLESQTYDSDNDGVTNTTYTYDRDQDNLVTVRHQYNATDVETARLFYFYDQQSRTSRLENDTNLDGTPNNVHYYIYSSGLLMIQDIDILNDGSINHRWIYFRDDDGVLLRAERTIDGVFNLIQTYAFDEAGNTTWVELDTNVDGTPDERRTYDYACWQ